MVEIDTGEDISEEEALWWPRGALYFVLVKGWKIAVDYKDREYLSPWSVSNSTKTCLRVSNASSIAHTEPPSSDTALE